MSYFNFNTTKSSFKTIEKLTNRLYSQDQVESEENPVSALSSLSSFISDKFNSLVPNVTSGSESITDSPNPNASTSNSTKLLEDQLLQAQKTNELIQSMCKDSICGPECQIQKKTSELQEKYDSAKTNIETASSDYEAARKAYTIYSQGEPYYNNLMENELTSSVKQQTEVISSNFQEEINIAKTMNAYYNSDIINSDNTAELYDEYLNKIQKIEEKIKQSHGDILTNDRKTYYENEALDSLHNWYAFLWYIYYLVVIIFILMAFLVPNQFNTIKKIIIILFILYFPYMTFPLFHYIKNSIIKTYNILFPKNVYKTL